MLAMALLLHGGLLGGMGGEAAGVDGAGEGAWTLATPAEGFLAASGTGELAHLLHLCLFRAFPRGASLRSQRLTAPSALCELCDAHPLQESSPRQLNSKGVDS